jgi:hypothetical protein
MNMAMRISSKVKPHGLSEIRKNRHGLAFTTWGLALGVIGGLGGLKSILSIPSPAQTGTI